MSYSGKTQLRLSEYYGSRFDRLMASKSRMKIGRSTILDIDRMAFTPQNILIDPDGSNG